MRAIFRKFKDGEVIAWLPDLPANRGCMMSYLHVGQHGEGEYPADTKPATPTEYAPLLRELESIYGERVKAVSRYVRK